MLVLSDSGFVGTIGGGIAEKELLERARERPRAAELVPFDHAGEKANSVCSGSQSFAIVPLTDHDSTVLEEVAKTLGNDGTGTLRLSSSGLDFTAGKKTPRAFRRDDEQWSYEETIGKLETLYIIGGGHVSLALSRVMATLPFRIVVLDDREEVPTMQGNSFADEAKVIPYEEIAEHVGEGDLSYVTIMTHAHRADQDVLERLLPKKFRYLGMMGSPAKVRQLFSNLEGKGVTREELSRVYSPIGLRIASHTPEEIAISIRRGDKCSLVKRLGSVDHELCVEIVIERFKVLRVVGPVAAGLDNVGGVVGG
jgi:xanthine dehydrogenase accessory factor